MLNRNYWLSYILVSLLIVTSCKQDKESSNANNKNNKERVGEELYEKLDITPGVYSEDLILANDLGTGLVTGYYNKRLGWDDIEHQDRYICAFSFKAHKQENIILLEGAYPGSSHVIRGNIEIISDEKIKIKLYEEPDDCGEIANKILEEGLIFELQEKKDNWKAVRIVSKTRAYIHKDPDDKKSKTQIYAKEGQGVSILQEKDDWIEIVYLDFTKKEIRGWIKTSDLYSMDFEDKKSDFTK